MVKKRAVSPIRTYSSAGIAGESPNEYCATTAAGVTGVMESRYRNILLIDSYG